MAVSPSLYEEGTITLVAGEAEVVGDGTAWLIAGVVGGMLCRDGYSVPIREVSTDGALVLAYGWPGADAEDAAYVISRDSALAADAQFATNALVKVIRDLSLSAIAPVGSGTLAERDAASPAPAVGEFWLQVELGTPLNLYRKEVAGWSGPYRLTGPAGVGEGGYGLPAGGTTGQALIKASNDNGDVVWSGGVRERLTAHRTYYVLADGSDANAGLISTAGGAFATLAKAMSVVLGTLDLAGYNVTIAVGAGTYAGLTMASPQVGAGNITIQGDLTTPSNVTTGPILVDGAGCRLFLGGLRVDKGTDQYCLCARNGGYIRTTGLMHYKSTSGGHRLIAEKACSIDIRDGELIEGAVTGGHYFANINGVIDCSLATSWTAVGTATQSGGFAYAASGGNIYGYGNTKSGAFAGPRYLAALNGIINSNGGGANYFPGDAPGVADGGSGGRYF